MFRVAIYQNLFCQNVLRENSPMFNDVKVFDTYCILRGKIFWIFL